MAETLGSLCDKLSVIKLKQWHTEDAVRLESLMTQELGIVSEIDEYIAAAISGEIPKSKLRFQANKVYDAKFVVSPVSEGTFAQKISQLSQINCALWHQQELVYRFDSVPFSEKDLVIKKLADLNLQRNQCIDAIDASLFRTVSTIS